MLKQDKMLWVNIQHQLMILLSLFLVLLLLKLGAPVLAPVGLAVFIVALAWPIKNKLNNYLPEPYGYIGSFVALACVLTFFVSSFWLSTGEVMRVMPKYQEEFSRFWQVTQSELVSGGIGASGEAQLEEVRRLVVTFLLNFHETFLMFIIVLAYVMLALPEMSGWKNKLRTCFGKDHSEQVVAAANQWGKSFQAYLVAVIVSGLISAIATWVVAVSFGLDLALTWAFLAFLLSFIPVIGAFLTVIPPVVLAIFQFDDPSTPWMVFAVMGSVHMFIGHIIEPKLYGNTLAMSPVAVLFSLALWSFLWGIPGALLASPFTHGIILACSHYERTRWIAFLLSEKKWVLTHKS